ncbi:MAG: hypothetical protein C5B57_05425 [Blastocatellia bacterium]|nr:MAG: hypothetical protein C5B57_05425 [Blastocatellia bacterium]
MQQRQLRLGDILDDYCPRERRVTNHAVVAMVGPDVKQTRCTTCDAEHEYKQARVPRQRRKADAPAVLAQGVAGRPKRVIHDPVPNGPAPEELIGSPNGAERPVDELLDEAPSVLPTVEDASGMDSESDKIGDAEAAERESDIEEGPVHRPLIRATLPRPEGQPPPTRPAPEFTIRQPAGRQGRFRPRHQRGPSSPFHGNRSGNISGGGMPRHGGGRPPMPRSGKRHGPGHKRSK